jgi:16S rRNA (adenine1518-N6/adenine1519-N6)-dimethyltransferase
METNLPVIEIGTGLGALTSALSQQSRKVTTIEIDTRLIEPLEETLAPFHNVHTISADFMHMDVGRLLDEAFENEKGIVAANIPYYITTPILEKLLAHRSRISRIVLLVQQEVARRVVAAAGSDDYGSLSVFVQYQAEAVIAGEVPPTVFMPQPDVKSAILVLTPSEHGTVPVSDEELLFHIVRAAFGQRRKTVLNALMRAPASFGLGVGMEDRVLLEELLRRCNINPERRGETISLQEYAILTDAWPRPTPAVEDIIVTDGVQ